MNRNRVFGLTPIVPCIHEGLRLSEKREGDGTNKKAAKRVA